MFGFNINYVPYVSSVTINLSNIKGLIREITAMATLNPPIFS